jgi:hypothetical protein
VSRAEGDQVTIVRTDSGRRENSAAPCQKNAVPDLQQGPSLPLKGGTILMTGVWGG